MPPTLVPVPVHPVTGLKITNGQLTVPALLQQPTRITSGLAALLNDQLAQTNLIALFFSGGGGGVTGGAVAYDKIPTSLDWNLTGLRQAEEIAPAAEYPLVGMTIGEEIFLAAVRKYGGKFYVTDEARDRNDTGLVALLTSYLAWTIQYKLNQAAVTLADQQSLGHSPADVLARLAESLGLRGRAPAALLDSFEVTRLPREPWIFAP